ncbi:MAG: hypothetical protein DRP63_08970 [Planctomycetota bacterium]|nr:MAG: hypothetical protein DRP63_08970 [Planctomycetota bacterium]
MRVAAVLWLAAIVYYVILIPPVKVASPADASVYFSKAEMARIEGAAPYRNASFRYAMARTGVTLLLLFGFAFWFGQRVQRITSTSKLRSFLLFFTIVYWLLFVVRLPIDYANGVVLESRWGFLRMSGVEWFWHHLKSSLVSFCGGLVAVTLIGLFMLRIKRWWLPSAAISVVFSFVVAFLAPLVIAPLFARFRPLKDEKLATRLLSIAKKAHISAERVLVCDASSRYTHTNAYFSGLFSTRRIVLYDTLLENHPFDEVEVVVAHEAGHARYHHILKGLLLGAIVLFAFWASVAALVGWLAKKGITSVQEPRVLAFVALCAITLSLLLAPLENYLNRRCEAQADLEALRLTNNPDAFIRAEKRLALHNLSSLTPGKLRYLWFATHPTPLERIGMAEAFKAGEIH